MIKFFPLYSILLHDLTIILLLYYLITTRPAVDSAYIYMYIIHHGLTLYTCTRANIIPELQEDMLNSGEEGRHFDVDSPK